MEKSFECWTDENKKLHRNDDLPAFVTKKRKEWWFHGKLHREKGPAVTEEDSQYSLSIWWRKGKIHRVDGPAFIYKGNDTEISWFYKGKLVMRVFSEHNLIEWDITEA